MSSVLFRIIGVRNDTSPVLSVRALSPRDHTSPPARRENIVTSTLTAGWPESAANIRAVIRTDARSVTLAGSGATRIVVRSGVGGTIGGPAIAVVKSVK